MSQTTEFERESHQLVEEFRQRDLVAPEVAERIARLRAQGKPQEALELILAERQGPTASSEGGPDQAATRAGRR